jgi:hypothetical protein
MENLPNSPRVISKTEVTENLVRGLLGDQDEFRSARSILKHGQKDRLMEAMASYPLLDSQFDETEPELRSALSIWKRISDSLVALGTEAAIEGILSSFSQNQQQNEANGLTEGAANGETTEG